MTAQPAVAVENAQDGAEAGPHSLDGTLAEGEAQFDGNNGAVAPQFKFRAVPISNSVI